MRHDDLSVHVQGSKAPSGVLESKSCCRMAKTFDFCLQVIVKWEINRGFGDTMNNQNLSEWCHMSHRRSSPWPIRICVNDDCYTAFIHASNCINLRTDLVHTIEIIQIAYGTSWTSRRRSWMRKGEEVELYLPEPSARIYMPQIAGLKHRNALRPQRFSLR